MYSAMAVAVVAACTKDPAPESGNGDKPGNGDEPGTEQPGEKTARECALEELSATPVGDTLTFEITADAAWTVATEDECDWITVTPASGAAGDATLEFIVVPNTSGRDRSVSFFVSAAETETHKAGEIYEIFIAQVKMEYAVAEKDMAFLQWMVDNKVYGDATPSPDWFDFNPEGFVGISFGTDVNGKYTVAAIDYRSGDEQPSSALFNSFPPTMELPDLEYIYINCTSDGGDANTMAEWVKCALRGSEFPTTWDCPKLRQVHLECVGLQGTIPASFAALPNLTQLFIRACDIYGALPHDWTSGLMQSIVIGFDGAKADCPNLGYIVPKTLDCILNSDRWNAEGTAPVHRDKVEYKLGGAPENWIGYENGWGQRRYELFDATAEKGNETKWSAHRKFSEGPAEEVAPGGIRNPHESDNGWYIDTWAWYFFRNNVPETLAAWDQAAADAYTEAAAAKARVF